jgi:hypothetical protein
MKSSKLLSLLLKYLNWLCTAQWHFVPMFSVLYTHCVVKLQEFIECDAGTAALALECFNELFGLVCSHYKDKLGQFLGEVGMSVLYFMETALTQ